jgi:hypothetical protein
MQNVKYCAQSVDFLSVARLWSFFQQQTSNKNAKGGLFPSLPSLQRYDLFVNRETFSGLFSQTAPRA